MLARALPPIGWEAVPWVAAMFLFTPEIKEGIIPRSDCSTLRSETLEGNMWKVALVVVALNTLAMSHPAMSQGRGIHIFEARYGVGERAMHVGAIVAASCEGRYRCEFPVRNEFFGRDPAFGIVKEVVVHWTCGAARNRSAFPENSEARLSC